MKNATANIKVALLLLHVDRSKKLERRFLAAYFLISPVGRRLEDDSECNANICALGAFYCNIKVIQFRLFVHSVRTQNLEFIFTLLLK